jgi:hypothetical protein
LEITAEDFRRHFDLLSDQALLATNRDELVEVARACYDEELEKRGLAPAPESEGAVVSDEVPAAGNRDEFVTVIICEDPGEALETKQRLEDAGITVQLANEIPVDVMVKSEDLFRALDTLGLELTEEELAAQAEEAGREVEPE